jgi:16S rRNA (uracil1498-N3)-methyltransferase
MPQYFLDIAVTINKAIHLTGDDYQHLVKVRRVKAHDIIQVRDADGKSFEAEITSIEAQAVTALITGSISRKHNPFHVALAMALVKGSKFDFIIQKAVELGVSEIHPLVTERTIPLIENKVAKKLERWQKIAREAAKQCLRDNVPEVTAPVMFTQYLEQNTAGLRVLAHLAGDAANLRSLIHTHQKQAVTVAIGPEGGFAPAEVSSARDRGWHIITYGYTQLRAETAAIVLPSLVLYELQERDRANQEDQKGSR